MEEEGMQHPWKRECLLLTSQACTWRRYGIRTENLLLCKKAEKNGYGQFMEFETVTLVPYEREAILPEMLTREELEWLNDYHRRVYDTIGPMLIEEEREWLKEATAEI